MKRWHWLGWTTFLVLVVLLGFRDTASASTAPGGPALEAEVDGYRLALASQNAWARGDNTILVTLTDSMGMPVDNAEVALQITPRLDAHGETEAGSHGSEGLDETMAGLESGNGAAHGSAVHGAPPNAPEAPSHGAMSSAHAAPTVLEAPSHDSMSSEPAAPMAPHGQGTYIIRAPLASAGRHEVRAMVHVDGEMLEAEFVVGGAASSSRSIVLWSFAGINAAIVLAAGLLRKNRLVTVKNGALA